MFVNVKLKFKKRLLLFYLLAVSRRSWEWNPLNIFPFSEKGQSTPLQFGAEERGDVYLLNCKLYISNKKCNL